VIWSLRNRLLGPTAAALLAVTLLAASADASTYGRLIVRNDAMPSSALDTRFAHISPPRSFLLVVTEPAKTKLQFTWSLHCYNAARRESGGASGEATVTTGRWVKQVRANWIAHPAYCTGGVTGSATGNPVLVRIFAN
jgi:hypothetical protein